MRAGRLSRLPPPRFPLLNDVTQTWEGEMEGEYQGLLTRSLVQQSMPRSRSLVGREVDGRAPARTLEVDGVDRRIAAAQESLAAGGNGCRHVAWCVPGCGNSVDAGYDLRLTINQVELALNAGEVLLCGREQELLEVPVYVQFRQAGR
jgi:hypothetical protein